jgi:hypothetical protein
MLPSQTGSLTAQLATQPVMNIIEKLKSVLRQANTRRQPRQSKYTHYGAYYILVFREGLIFTESRKLHGKGADAGDGGSRYACRAPLGPGSFLLRVTVPPWVSGV